MGNVQKFRSCALTVEIVKKDGTHCHLQDISGIYVPNMEDPSNRYIIVSFYDGDTYEFGFNSIDRIHVTPLFDKEFIAMPESHCSHVFDGSYACISSDGEVEF